MKAAWRIAGFAGLLLVVAGAGYGVVRMMRPTGHGGGHDGGHVAGVQESGLRWLREAYGLDEETWGKIEALHEGYYPVCGEMCGRIERANARVSELMRGTDRMTPELEAALREAERTHADCRAALLRHVFEVAALMPPEKARRYLDEMGPRLVEEGRHADEVMASGRGR